MTRTISPKAAIRSNRTPKVEDMLRDIAYVLHLTKKVKASMIEDAAMPTGGRFATDNVDIQAETAELAFA